jgi:D-alanyl-D-alanine endopeptidase (penicillin-binding protein 7)
VRRRDWLWVLFEEAVRALLWFHPAVWMLLARIALSREQVVDREVVRRTGSRRVYLEALRAVAGRPWQAAVLSLPFFHRGHLRERVIHLCKEVPMSRPRMAILMTTSASLLALTAVLGILAFPMTGTAWAVAMPVHPEGDIDIHPPQPIDFPGVLYPAKEKFLKIEGQVLSEVVIDEQGKVVSVEVKKSSGNANLDYAAGQSIWRTAFLPATRKGKPVAAYYYLRIDFEVYPGEKTIASDVP